MPPSPSGAGSGSGSGTGAASRSGGGYTPSGFISRYQILEKIGEGGMGALFLARDPAIDRLLAIKLLRRGFDTDELRSRFAREAKAAGRLRHPNIVTIFDVGEHEGDPFIAMEFLAGETLDELIRHGARLSLARRLKLLEELCDGLSYAHRAGIVHRDIKPANLIVDSEGVLKILDFGIVRLEEGGSTAAGMLVGTVNYMSPEQVHGGEIDHRSDIFAVGLVAYELLTARQAFRGSIKDGLFNKILNVQIEPLASVLPQLDKDVIAIVEQALQKEPVDRYQDLARMRNDIQRVRQRIEAMEERAVDLMTGDSGETAYVTAPGLPTPLGGTPKSAPALQAAERALEKGEYRAALTLAGRSAAADPRDREASGILAKAEAALLERGRAMESSGAAAIPSAAASPRVSSSGAVTPSGAVAPSGAYAPQAAHPLLWAVVGAVVILVAIVAGVLVPKMLQQPADSNAPRTASAPEQEAPASTVPPPASSAPVPAPQEPPQAGRERAAQRVEPSRGSVPPLDPRARPSRGQTTPTEPAPAAPAAPVPPAAPTIVRAGRDVPVPRRINFAEPQYPAAALEAGVQGTVRLELTIGRDGRVADVRVLESVRGLDDAAVSAVKRWEFAPSLVGGAAVPVLHVVNVDFALPAKPAAPAAPPVQKPAVPPPPVASRETPAASTPSAVPKPDPAAAEAAIRETLRRYESGWEARDADAIARVRQLSSDELARVRDTLEDASEYAMDIAIQSIRVEPDGRRATAVCIFANRFRPKGRGVVQPRPVTHTITLERRASGWIIASVR